MRGGEFGYIKPSGPIIQFDDDEEEAARKHREEKQAGGGADAKAAAKEEKARAKQEKARAKEEKRASKAARTGAATNGGAAIPDALGTKADGAPDGGIDAGGAKPHAAAQDDAPMFALHDVNVSVASGELVCVVGRVGSGKTSLVRWLDCSLAGQFVEWNAEARSPVKSACMHEYRFARTHAARCMRCCLV